MIHHRLTGEQSLTKHKLPASLFERQEGLDFNESHWLAIKCFSVAITSKQQQGGLCLTTGKVHAHVFTDTIGLSSVPCMQQP